MVLLLQIYSGCYRGIFWVLWSRTQKYTPERLRATIKDRCNGRCECSRLPFLDSCPFFQSCDVTRGSSPARVGRCSASPCPGSATDGQPARTRAMRWTAPVSKRPHFIPLYPQLHHSLKRALLCHLRSGEVCAVVSSVIDSLRRWSMCSPGLHFIYLKPMKSEWWSNVVGTQLLSVEWKSGQCRNSPKSTSDYERKVKVYWMSRWPRGKIPETKQVCSTATFHTLVIWPGLNALGLGTHISFLQDDIDFVCQHYVHWGKILPFFLFEICIYHMYVNISIAGIFILLGYSFFDWTESNI